MKNKIRRAFDMTKPNVLNRVLEDCAAPAKEVPAAPKKKRKMSDRAMQFVATAASIALLIGALAGGVVYFREYYAGQGFPGETGGNQLGSNPNSFWNWLRPGETASTQDPKETINPALTEPLPTVGYDTSEEGLRIRAMEIVCPGYYYDEQTPEEEMQVTLNWVDGWGNTNPSYHIQYKDCTYHFVFRGDNGALESIAAFSNSVFYSSLNAKAEPITPSAAAWIALMDLDPTYYGATTYAEYEIGLLHAYIKDGDMAYHSNQGYAVTITRGSTRASYMIDGLFGTIQSKNIREIMNISLEEATEIVYDTVLAERPDCYLLDAWQEGDGYWVTACSSDDPVTGDVALIPLRYYVDAATGQIASGEKGFEYWDEKIATTTALAYAQAQSGGAEILDCTYMLRSGLNSYYQVKLELQVPGGKEILTVDVYEMYSSTPIEPVVPVAPPFDEQALLTARDIALSIPGIQMDDVTHLEITIGGPYYRVYFKTKEKSYSYYLDQDGNVTYDGGVASVWRPVETTAITWQDARDLCLEACGRSLEDVIGFAYEYTRDKCYHVELSFWEGDFSWVVDGASGAFLEDMPEGIIGQNNAIEIAVDHITAQEDGPSGSATSIECKLDDASGVYYVYFLMDSFYCEVGVNAHTGEVMYATFWLQESAPPDGEGYETVGSYMLGTEPGRRILLEIKAKAGFRHYTMSDPSTGAIIERYVQTPAGVLDKMSAMNTFAKHLGMDTFTSGSLAMLGSFSNGIMFYCVVIPAGDCCHVALMSPSSGEILFATTIFE